MTRLVRGCTFIVWLVATTGGLAAEPGFGGSWDTTFGPMYLNQQAKKVSGFYFADNAFCKIEGQLDKTRWTFRYKEPDIQGEGYFELTADGQSMRGRWRPEGAEEWEDWLGRRLAKSSHPQTFAGLWSTSFGRMRLEASQDEVRGCYAVPYGATIAGKAQDERLKFEYHEPNVEGEGWFQLAADGRAFCGQWRPKESEEWLDWFGVRVEPVPQRSWLVIVEAYWERDLAEQEYSFGSMLRTFFARVPQVQVRHRYVDDAGALARACHGVTYLAEPVVLVVASHGSGDGVGVNGQTVGATVFSDSLKYAANVRLLHFSSCRVMHDQLPVQVINACKAGSKFPISGYTEPADWAGSAVLEFLYLDMILSRGLSPADAAKQVRLLVPFASPEKIPGSHIPPAGFRILEPSDLPPPAPPATD